MDDVFRFLRSWYGKDCEEDAWNIYNGVLNGVNYEGESIEEWNEKVQQHLRAQADLPIDEPPAS